jgi:putative Holliday junction resolvase
MPIIQGNITEFSKALIPHERLLGLDFGGKKIGMALSDTSRTIASPLKVLMRVSFKKDIMAIFNEITLHKVCAIVLGLPLQMNGIEGESCIGVREFAAKIIAKSNIPIYLQDERLSSKAANRTLIDFNITRLKRNLIDDKIAACFMLQGVLDQINYHKQKCINS